MKAEKSYLQYRKLLNFLKIYVYIENLITINIKNKSNKKTTLKAARSNDVVKATFKKYDRIITILQSLKKSQKKLDSWKLFEKILPNSQQNIVIEFLYDTA